MQLKYYMFIYMKYMFICLYDIVVYICKVILVHVCTVTLGLLSQRNCHAS